MKRKFRIGDFPKVKALRTEDVPVPEWATEDMTAEEVAGLCVTVRAMTGKQRDAFEASLVSGEGKKRKADLVNVRAKLVAMCLVNEPGDAPLTEFQLGALDAAGLDRVFVVCQRLAGLTPEDVEELEKNSSPGLNGSLPSISASPSDLAIPTNSTSA
jgi:hypothetical protein